MKLKLNVALGGYKAGQTIDIPDFEGNPLSRFWRARLKDSERDDCVQIVGDQPSEKEPAGVSDKPNEPVSQTKPIKKKFRKEEA